MRLMLLSLNFPGPPSRWEGTRGENPDPATAEASFFAMGSRTVQESGLMLAWRRSGAQLTDTCVDNKA